MENPSYYSILTAEVRYDDRLTSLQKLLYSEVTALTNKTGECWASNSYFAKLYKVSDTWVSLSIKKLLKCGYLESRIAVNQGNTRYLSLTTVKDPIELQLKTSLTTVKDPYLTTVKDTNTTRGNIKKNNKFNSENTPAINKFSNKEDISQAVVEELATKYDCPASFVWSCWDSAGNWMEANGKTKKNYKAFLDNWVKSEVVKVKNTKKGFNNGIRIAKFEDYRDR